MVLRLVNVKNILIYVSDSLRWDYLPNKIKKIGLVFKTVAQSIYTPVSFASMVTGLNPPRHGVLDFSDKIPRSFFTLFDLPLEVSYWDHPHDPMYHVLNKPPRIALEDLKEPFLYIERGIWTHIPYDPSLKGKIDVREYIKRTRKDYRRLKEDYRRAVERATQEFFERINILKRRGILDRTLVIFTSDHGEVLDEYGPMSHIFPVCPETVYVPTVFIHPELPKGIVGKGIIRHVDILPTILHALNLKVELFVEGVNVLKNDKRLLGFNYYVRRHRGNVECLSIWDEKGGYVVHRTNKLNMLKTVLLDIITYTHNLKPLKYFKSHIVYGSGIKDAEKLIKVFESMPTYGYADDIYCSPLTEEAIKLKLKFGLYKLSKSLVR